MKFSVITPCLNRAHYLPAAIESVLAQTYPDFEHLIVDGGSTDETVAVVQRYRHLRFLSEPDRGVYDALNKGLRLATGDVVVLLNSDDLLAASAFSIVSEIFRHTVGTMLVSGGCEIFRVLSGGREQRMHRYDQPRHYALSVRNVTVGYPNINARFFRKRFFDQVGEFDLRYGITSDRELLLRAAVKRIPDAPVPRILYRYRWHAESLTMNAGTSSLLQAMDENWAIGQAYTSKVAPADRVWLVRWRRETVATRIMILVLQRRSWTAFRTFCRHFGPRFLFTFIRVGALAWWRRLKNR